MASRTASLRRRFASRAGVFGIFVKTASHQVIELLGGPSLDFVVIDAEHAPFDRNVLDVCLLAARACDLPAIVRIPELTEAAILAPLDMGAAGVMVPRIRSAEEAERAVTFAKYAKGRGFSNSARAGRYGLRSIPDHARGSDDETCVIAMIEDLAGIEAIAAIAAVEGIDALFIGRVDLTIALGRTDTAHPDVEAAVRRIFAAAPSLRPPLGVLASDPARCRELKDKGVGMFLLGTDQGLLRAAASSAADAARGACA